VSRNVSAADRGMTTAAAVLPESSHANENR
jgi:hypothetical protein